MSNHNEGFNENEEVHDTFDNLNIDKEETSENELLEFEEDEEYYHPEEFNNERNNKVKSLFYDLIFYTVLIFVCIYIIPNFVMQRTVVDGSSMENSLFNEEHLMVEKISYRFDMLNRFDVIVFYPYGRDHEEYYVKRIIGLPGETIQIKGADIYINGEILEENYGKDPIESAGRAVDPIVLGEDEYFVMGDNRTISKDSRYSVVGNVKKENIGGRAFFRIWPLDRFGLID